MGRQSLDSIIYNGLTGGDIRNLYSEVEELLRRNNKSIENIDWVECVEYKDLFNSKRREIPLDNFISAAKSTDYDADMWKQQIPMSLKIYGKDRSFVIMVREYDGKQWLEYINMDVKRPSNVKYVNSFKLNDEDSENPQWIEEGKSEINETKAC